MVLAAARLGGSDPDRSVDLLAVPARALSCGFARGNKVPFWRLVETELSEEKVK